MKHCPHCGGQLPTSEELPTLTLEDRFWFGKCKGKTLREVLATDPQYLFWAIQKVDDFNVTPELRATARRAAGEQTLNQALKPYYGTSPHDDIDWDRDLNDDPPF